jgi:hypothetical protein
MTQLQRLRYSCTWFAVHFRLLYSHGGDYVKSYALKMRRAQEAYVTGLPAHRLLRLPTPRLSTRQYQCRHQAIPVSPPGNISVATRPLYLRPASRQPASVSWPHPFPYARLRYSLCYAAFSVSYGSFPQLLIFPSVCCCSFSLFICYLIWSSHSSLALFLSLQSFLFLYLYPILKFLSPHKSVRLLSHHQSRFLRGVPTSKPTGSIRHLSMSTGTTCSLMYYIDPRSRLVIAT